MVGGFLLIVPVAEVVIPITPVISAVVAEKEIPETFGIEVLGGDAAVVFHLAGGDGLALIVFRG